jgi:hypothetical protein
MPTINKSTNKKEYQFTVRIPKKLKKDVTARFLSLGFNTLAEYIRHLVAIDVYPAKVNHVITNKTQD